MQMSLNVYSLSVESTCTKLTPCKMHSLGFVEWKRAQYVRSVFLYSDVRLHTDMFQWQYIYLLSKYTNSCI